MPFEATTDAEGRLSTLELRIPAAGKRKAATYEMSYRDYGKVAAPAAPATSRKAPAVVYEMLNG